MSRLPKTSEKIKIHSLNEREWVRRRRNRCKGEEIREKEGGYGDREEEGEAKMKEETEEGRKEETGEGRKAETGEGGRRRRERTSCARMTENTETAECNFSCLDSTSNINNLCTGLALLCILNVFCSISNYQALNKCQGLFILLFPTITFIIHESYKVSVTRSILKD